MAGLIEEEIQTTVDPLLPVEPEVESVVPLAPVNTTSPPVAVAPTLYEVDKPTQTVAGQLDGLLASDSPYIKQAQVGAMEQANSRGLLNSSIAASAGERAAIESALPIASQDATTHFTQANANQNAENDSSLQLQKDTSAYDRSVLAEENANYRSELTNQYNLESLDQKDRTTMAAQISSSMSLYEDRKLEILSDPDLDETAKAAAVAFLDNNLHATLESTSALLGIELDFGDIALPPWEDTTPKDLYEPPVLTDSEISSFGSSILSEAEGNQEIQDALGALGIETTQTSTGLAFSTTAQQALTDLKEAFMDPTNISAAKKEALVGLTTAGPIGAAIAGILGFTFSGLVGFVKDVFSVENGELSGSVNFGGFTPEELSGYIDVDTAEDTSGVSSNTSTGVSGSMGMGSDAASLADAEANSGDGGGETEGGETGGADSGNEGSGGETEGSCFIAGTQVIMADQTIRNIEDVEVGESLYGFDSSYNAVLAYDRPLLGSRSLYSINGSEYFVTAEHPFMTTAGWKSIDPEATAREEGIKVVTTDLAVGDVLIHTDGNVVLKEIKIASLDENTQLYNFKLDGNNTYFANGFLVHNKI